MALKVLAAGLSDVGLLREHNEDSFAVLDRHGLYLVADGMGGHRAGAVASRMAADAMGAFFDSTMRDDATWPFHFDPSLSLEENRLITSIKVANRSIYEESARNPDHRGMGTTVVGVLVLPQSGKVYVGHVGDSRCYRVRGGEIRQLTQDHSLVNEYLRAMPDLPPEQRDELPRNVITRALGMTEAVMVDLVADEAKADDVYVLCSDGLSGMVSDDEILSSVLRDDEPEVACRTLVALANDHGGEDNVTAVVVRVLDGDRASRRSRPSLDETRQIALPAEPDPRAEAAHPSIDDDEGPTVEAQRSSVNPMGETLPPPPLPDDPGDDEK